MKPVSSTVILAALAASVAACSVQERTYYPRQQYAYAPATTTYYSAPGATVVATTPAPACIDACPSSPITMVRIAMHESRLSA